MISRIQRFYRYFVYRIYHINNNDPDMKVISFIFMVHTAHAMSCLFILSIIFSFDYSGLDKSEVSLLALLFCFLQLFIFFKPNKWKTYFKEFENESKRERRKGSFLVWGYLIFSLSLQILIPVIWDAFFK